MCPCTAAESTETLLIALCEYKPLQPFLAVLRTKIFRTSAQEGHHRMEKPYLNSTIPLRIGAGKVTNILSYLPDGWQLKVLITIF